MPIKNFVGLFHMGKVGAWEGRSIGRVSVKIYPPFFSHTRSPALAPGSSSSVTMPWFTQIFLKKLGPCSRPGTVMVRVRTDHLHLFCISKSILFIVQRRTLCQKVTCLLTRQVQQPNRYRTAGNIARQNAPLVGAMLLCVNFSF